MITEIYIEGNRLDLFEDEEITINQVSKDLKDISKIFADYSQSFNVPASNKNNSIFKHYYNANIDGGYDARTRKPANIVVSGMDFKRGKMRLDSVDIVNGEPTSYKITFFGDTIKIKDLIGDDKLSDLDFLVNFNHPFSGSQVKQGLKTGLNFVVDGVNYNQSIIYPLVSYRRQYYYNSNASDHTNTDKLANIAYHAHPTTSQHGVDYRDLKPAIRLATVMKAIENQYGFQFNSPFFESQRFIRIYMNLNRSVESLANGLVVIENLTGTVSNAPQNQLPLRWRYRLDVTPAVGFETVPYKKRLFFNDELIYEDTNFVTGTTSREQNTEIDLGSNNYSVRAEIVTEQAFEFEADTLLRKQFLFAQPTIFDNNYPVNVIETIAKIQDEMPDVKVIDFLTSLFKTFNLIAFADNDEIFIQDLQTWYTSGAVYDITKYIETKKEVVKRGEIFKQIDFKFEESEQILSDEFRQSNPNSYGDLEFTLRDENGEPLPDVDGDVLEVKSIFENPIYERLNDLEDGSQTPIQYCLYTDRQIEPIVGKPFLLFVVAPSLASHPIAFLEENNSQFLIDASVFQPSHSEFMTDSFNLNFNAEISEYTGSVMRDTIYQRYWSDYVGDAFSIKRRNYEVEGILPPNLLNNLKLNDRLIIKGSRYLISSISSDIVKRRDKFLLVNDIFDSPLSTDILNSSLFRQTSQDFDNGSHTYSVTYVGQSGKSINKLDLGDGVLFATLNTKTTLSPSFEVSFFVDVNATGLERKMGIQVIDNINNPIFVILQQA